MKHQDVFKEPCSSDWRRGEGEEGEWGINPKIQPKLNLDVLYLRQFTKLLQIVLIIIYLLKGLEEVDLPGCKTN